MSERRFDISDYLLGELSPEEHAEAERMMRDDPGLRAEVERLRPVVSRLEELPEEAWEAQPPPLRTTPPTSMRAAPRRLVLRPALAAAACAVLVAAGTGIGLLIADGDGSTITGPTETIALQPVAGGDEAGARGTARLTGVDGGEAQVEVSDLARSQPDEYYELWLLNAPDDLVSLGSFKVPQSGDATVRVPLPTDPRRFRFLDVSVEEIDGGPGHSGRSVLRAPT